MNKKTLLSLIILDLIIMLIAASIFLFRFMSLSAVSALTKDIAATIENKAAPDAVTETAPAVNSSAETPKETPRLRNIKFTFRNSKAKKVEIIGDFNQWIPQSMEKGADNVWSVSLAIPPGEYAYNFVVDGLPKRDPNNSKVSNVGRGFPNSFLKLEPR
jgi:hypothetical protein